MPALSILSAVLLLLTLPPFRLHGAAAFALVPLLLIVKRQNSFRGSAAAGAFAGLFYFGYGFYGVVYFSPLVYLGVLTCHVLFLALFCGLLFRINRLFKQDVVFWTAPALAWTVLSFLYSYSPLGEAGTQVLFSQPRLLEMMQISHLLGVYAVGFLFLLFNASVALLIEKRSRSRFVFVSISLFLIAANFLWGRKVMAQPVAPGVHSIALIQHNLPVEKEWWLKNQPLILARYRELALEAGQRKPLMIIFPSFALPLDAYRQPAFFESLARETQSFLLVSTYVPAVENRRIADVGQFEMALLYSSHKGLVGAEKAVQGPPFRRIHEILGNQNQLLETPAGKMGILLCFEDTISVHARREVKDGAKFLTAISNPGHFNKTFLPEYHLWQDQLRAIETGRPVIRVSAQGPTAFIDRFGRIQKRAAAQKPEILYGEI